MINKSKKRKVTVLTLLASVVVIGGGTLAFFSAESTKKTEGVIGTVVLGDIKLNLENAENFNPGDEFIENSYKGKTTPHALTFSVKNNGSKSIRTRNIIDISFKDNNDLDPNSFALFEKTNNGNVDLSTLKNLDVSKFVFEKDGKKTLRYVIQGANLNANSGIENDDVAEQNRDSMKLNEAKTEVSYAYQLGLSPNVKDVYQGSGFTVDLTAQALQYRNTKGNGVTESDADWKTVFTDQIEVNN